MLGKAIMVKMLANNGDWKPSVADTGQHGVEIGGIAQSAETVFLDLAKLVLISFWQPIGETGQAELVSRRRFSSSQVHVRPANGQSEPGRHCHVHRSRLQPGLGGAVGCHVTESEAYTALDCVELPGFLHEGLVRIDGSCVF